MKVPASSIIISYGSDVSQLIASVGASFGEIDFNDPSMLLKEAEEVVVGQNMEDPNNPVDIVNEVEPVYAVDTRYSGVGVARIDEDALGEVFPSCLNEDGSLDLEQCVSVLWGAVSKLSAKVHGPEYPSLAGMGGITTLPPKPESTPEPQSMESVAEEVLAESEADEVAGQHPPV